MLSTNLRPALTRLSRFALHKSLRDHMEQLHAGQYLSANLPVDEVREIAADMRANNRLMPIQPIAMPPYCDASGTARIEQLEKALHDCMEWAASDCEHEACAGVIDVARAVLYPQTKT